MPDPAFSRVPFDQWRSGAAQAPLKWTVSAPQVLLSTHQRLLARVQAEVDGAEVARRRGKGELVLFFEIEADGQRYQDHTTLDLAKMQEGIQASQVQFSESAFVLPGEYALTLALYCTSTGEHSIRTVHLRVPELRADPLPHAWDGLPPVEIRGDTETPDLWFQPKIQSRLNLRSNVEGLEQIELVLNLTPSERAAGSQGSADRALAVMLPALKLLSGVDWRGAAIHVTVLDLAQQKIPFEQSRAAPIDWPLLRAALLDSRAGQIDVKALERRAQQAAFFRNQVAKRLAPHRIAIILSPVVAFESGEDLRAVEAERPADCSVYYLRFHQRLGPPLRTLPFISARPSASVGVRPTERRATENEVDQLARTLKPLGPRVFDIESPQQFRSALATILSAE